MSKTWRYVVRYDDGLAPCVEQGYCTLACCKPKIRKHASAGDWIVGFHSSSSGQAMLCYVMRVTEDPVPYADYWADPRFKGRRDNLYRSVNGRLAWVKNSFNDHDHASNHRRDLGGVNALVSSEYWYFPKQDSFSLFDHLDNGVVNRIWHRYVGQKYNGLLDGDLEKLLVFLEANYPQAHNTTTAVPARCNQNSKSLPSLKRPGIC